jgi:DoxX-like family
MGTVTGTAEMGRVERAAPLSKVRIWTGRVMSGLVILFLVPDAIIKFMKPTADVEAFNHVGWPLTLANALGVLLLGGVAVYAVPQTAVLGAILLTGYLGGAVATHMRIGDPLFSHVLFPTYLGVLLWGGLYLRDERLAALIPFRGKKN